jgi:hypothetical protein
VDNWVQYAPYILMAIVFCVSYNIFVTPKELGKILEKYVLKETYIVTQQEMKSDVSDIKIKVDKIYDKLISG